MDGGAGIVIELPFTFFFLNFFLLIFERESKSEKEGDRGPEAGPALPAQILT